MKGVVRAVYGVFGALAAGLGVLVLFDPSLVLPPEDYSPLTAHLIREQGAAGVFIGLMSFWCAFNFDGRRPVRYALLVFTALFAAVHWAEFFNARRHLMSPLLNSLPFLVLAAATPLRRSSGEASRRAIPATRDSEGGRI